jgi:hypothetical protein
MRKTAGLFVATLFLAGMAAPAAAQMGGQALELGVTGGVNFSTVSVSDDEGVDFKNRTAFGGGLFLRIPVGTMLAFTPQVLYVGKGTKATGDDLEGADLTLKLNYIDIPLLIQIPFGSGQGATPYLFGGPSLAFETGCTFGIESDVASLDIDCDEADEEDLELERKKFDYGATVGLGLRLPAGSGAFLVEGRYTFGLANLDDSGNTDDTFRNRSGAVYVGYSFALGGN